uniref:Uncharacterized protein n=1 Tax=Arion vulgaris TaxID=1028688 RepID=A0A0B6ZV86_9EUPU
MAPCTIISAILCVLVIVVAIIISFSTPNWASFEKNPSVELCGCTSCDCGMWLSCNGAFLQDGSIENCNWFFSNGFEIERELPGWFKIVQGLMSGAVVTSVLSLILGLLSLCCRCKRCNPYQTTGAFLGLTFVLVTAAVCVFGIIGHIQHNIEVLATGQANLQHNTFSWSFWIAVGAAVLSFSTSLVYFCAGRSSVQEECV